MEVAPPEAVADQPDTHDGIRHVRIVTARGSAGPAATGPGTSPENAMAASPDRHSERGASSLRGGRCWVQAVSTEPCLGSWLLFRMRSAARSAIMTVGAWVWPRMIRGITEASTTATQSAPGPAGRSRRLRHRRCPFGRCRRVVCRLGVFPDVRRQLRIVDAPRPGRHGRTDVGAQRSGVAQPLGNAQAGDQTAQVRLGLDLPLPPRAVRCGSTASPSVAVPPRPPQLGRCGRTRPPRSRWR